MINDHIYAHFPQAHSKLTNDHIYTPAQSVLGSPDLWGRIETFCNYGAAADHSNETLRAYREILGEFVKHMNSLGVRYPEQVQEEHIISFVLHKKKTCNGTSIHTYFGHAKAWFNWLLKRNLISSTPFANLKKPILPKTVIKPISSEQVIRMINCCSNHSYGKRDKAIILLLYDAGLRRLELCNIKIEDVDMKQGSIKVMGKGARERYVAMGKMARAALVDYLCVRRDKLPYLFVTRHVVKPSQLSPNAVTCIIKKFMDRAGIVGVKKGAHTLRHSFATAAIRNGANLFYIQSLLGHATLTMTRKYAATVDSEEAVRNHHTFSPADRMKR